eukprot:TRINITY_DN2127_c0_g1_i1.p1 TRINITY_DN2127_c0_g1~~TRINITY_DN2127_c0_g1_i1.p1  ORF type:complete len:374 (+),score=35.49 TRINITY_DN2127_c0_g1_i1:53-1123(+)
MAPLTALAAVRIEPRLVDLEAVVTRGVAIAVHDLPFFNTSEYECRWSTFYWPHFTLPNSREGDRLLCHLPRKLPIAKDPTPALTPLPPVEGALDHTLGGTGRLTILLVGANRLRWKATRVVAEETIFLVRGSLLNRTPDPSDRHTAEWFQKYVNDSQNPTDCSSARVAVVTDLHVAGLGCQLLMLAGLLLQSLQQGTVLLLTFTWNYARGLTPPMWQALFRPISSCEATLFPNQSSLRVSRHQVARKIKARYSREYFYPAPAWGRGLPAAFAARGYRWVIGQLLRYIVRPVTPSRGWWLTPSDASNPTAHSYVCPSVRANAARRSANSRLIACRVGRPSRWWSFCGLLRPPIGRPR